MNQVATRMETTGVDHIGSKPDAMVSMLERVLLDPNVPVERLERLLELQHNERQRQAKAIWSERMSSAQSELKAVLKNKDNQQTRSRYATYDALNEVAQPVYTRHGFSVTYDTSPADAPEMIRVWAYVENAGYERPYHIDMPCDGKGAKGNDVMTKTHAVKSAVTYGKATLLPMIFNLAVTDRADDDGNGAASEPALITEAQVLDIRDLLDSTGANVPQFLRAAKVERLEDIEAGKFNSLCAAIKRRAAERDAK